MTFYLLSDHSDEWCVSLKHLNRKGYPTLESILFLITIEENLYLSNFLRQYGRLYIFCMEKQMNLCLKSKKDKQKAHDLGIRMINILRANKADVMDRYNACKSVVDIIQEIVIECRISPDYFQGCDRRTYAAAHFSKLYKVECMNDIGNFLPSNQIEEYAFRTGFFPCIRRDICNNKLKYSFTTCSFHQKETPLWIDCPMFKFPLTFNLDFSYVDELLVLLEEIQDNASNVNIASIISVPVVPVKQVIQVVGPSKDCEKITVEAIREYIVNTIKTLCHKYPKKIGRFYSQGKNPCGLYEMVIIAARHKMCSLYKKYIGMGGRNTSLPSHTDFQYLSREQFNERIVDVFNQIGISSIMTLDEALIKLKKAKPGFMVKLANLIRRRIIWRRGPNVRMLPSFLLKEKEGPFWWFKSDAPCLPDHSLVFMHKRILTLLNEYLKPNIVKIVTDNFERYDLEEVIRGIHYNSVECTKLRHIAMNTTDSSLSSFLMCIFFIHREGTTIQENYAGWKAIMYSPFSKDVPGMDNYDRKDRMPVRSMLLLKSAKDIQRTNAGLYRSHPKRIR
jgi:hypothetical protein